MSDATQVQTPNDRPAAPQSGDKARQRPADATARDLLVWAEHVPELTAEYDQKIEARRQSANADLFHGDGRMRYERDAHAERAKYHEEQIGALVGTFREKLLPFGQDADSALLEVEKERLLLDAADPLDRLAPADLQRASARASFIQVDAARMTLRQLADRLRAEAERGDPALQSLWLREGQIRAATEQDARQRVDDPSSFRPSEAERTLADAIDALAQHVMPDVATKRARLAEREQAARTLQSTIRAARQTLDPQARADLARRFGIQGI